MCNMPDTYRKHPSHYKYSVKFKPSTERITFLFLFINIIINDNSHWPPKSCSVESVCYLYLSQLNTWKNLSLYNIKQMKLTHKLWSTSAFPTAAWRRKYYSNWELTPSILHLAKWLISNSEPDDNQRKNIYIRMRQTKITLDGPQSLNTIHLKQYN